MSFIIGYERLVVVGEKIIMAKQLKTIVKLQLIGGQATAAPPVGPALGQHGLAIGEFVSKFNDQTRGQPGVVLPVEIKVYQDRSYDFKVKTPATAYLIKSAAGVAKGAATPPRQKVGKISQDKLAEIAQTKLPDLNTTDINQAIKIVAGAARSMGIDVE